MKWLTLVLLLVVTVSCASSGAVCPPCPPPQEVSYPVTVKPTVDIPPEPELLVDSIDPVTAARDEMLSALGIDRQRLLRWGRELQALLEKVTEPSTTP